MGSSSTKAVLIDLLAKEGVTTGLSAKKKADLLQVLVEKKFPGVQLSAAELQAGAPASAGRIATVNGGSTAGWTLLSTGSTATTVISEKEALNRIHPGMGDMLRRTAAAANKAVRSCDLLTPQSSARLRLFSSTADTVARLTAVKSIEAGADLNAVDLGHAIGIAFLTNTSSLSMGRKFPSSSPMSRARFAEVINAMQAFGPRPGSAQEGRSEWTRREELVAQWLELSSALELAVGKVMGPMTPQPVSWDDDVVDFAGHVAHNAVKTIIPREAEGQTVDVLVSVLTGMVMKAVVRGRGGLDGTSAFAEGLSADKFADVTFDRFYAKEPVIRALAAKNIGSLGVLLDQASAQQPFTLHDGTKTALPQMERMMADITDPFTVLSFPGVGDGVFVAAKDGMATFMVRQRRSHSKSSGVVRFLTAARGVVRADGRVDASAEADWFRTLRRDTATWVLVGGAEPRGRVPTLTKALSLTNPPPVAAQWNGKLNADGREVQTTTQSGCVAWCSSRKGTCTGLASAALVPRVLKREPGAFPLTEKALAPASAEIPILTDTQLVEDAEEQSELAAAALRTDDDNVAEGGGGESDDDAAVGSAAVALDDDAFTPAFSASTDRVELDLDAADAVMDVVGGADHNALDVVEVPAPEAAAAAGAPRGGGRRAGTRARGAATSSTEVAQPEAAQVNAPGGGTSPAATGAAAAGGAPAVPEAQLTDAEFDKTLLEHVVKLQFLSTFSGNEHTEAGHLNEDRSDYWGQQLPWVRGMVKTGLVKVTGVPHATASPDHLLLVELPDGSVVPAVGEHKYSKYHAVTGTQAYARIVVKVGEDSYYEAVPHKWRVQLLHQAYVMNSRYTVLLRSGPTGPSSATVIEYTMSLLEEYGTLMNSRPIRNAFPLAYNRRNAEVSDAAFANQIPSTASPLVWYVLRSHAPSIRALDRYRERLGRPLPRSHALRPLMVGAYNAKRGAVDWDDMLIRWSTRGYNLKLSIEGKLTLRFFYYCLINAYRLYGAKRYWDAEFVNLSEAMRSERLSTLTLDQYRAGTARHAGTFADFAYDVGEELLRRRVALGGLSSGVGEAAALGPAPSPSIHGNFEVLAEFPDVARRLLKDRARRESNRQLDHRDFLTGTRFPLHDGEFSSTTPGTRVNGVSEYWTLRITRMVNVFGERPSVARSLAHETGTAFRNTRVLFWQTDGVLIRFARMLMHVRVEVGENGKPVDSDAPAPVQAAESAGGSGRRKRRVCVFCGKQSGRNKGFACVVCGEQFCTELCFDDFHTPGKEFADCAPASGGNSAGGAAAVSSTANAAGATTTTAANAAAALALVPLNLGTSSPGAPSSSSGASAAAAAPGGADVDDEDDDDAVPPRAAPFRAVATSRRRVGRARLDDDDEEEEDDDDDRAVATSRRGVRRHRDVDDDEEEDDDDELFNPPKRMRGRRR